MVCQVMDTDIQIHTRRHTDTDTVVLELEELEHRNLRLYTAASLTTLISTPLTGDASCPVKGTPAAAVVSQAHYQEVSQALAHRGRWDHLMPQAPTTLPSLRIPQVLPLAAHLPQGSTLQAYPAEAQPLLLAASPLHPDMHRDTHNRPRPTHPDTLTHPDRLKGSPVHSTRLRHESRRSPSLTQTARFPP